MTEVYEFPSDNLKCAVCDKPACAVAGASGLEPHALCETHMIERFSEMGPPDADADFGPPPRRYFRLDANVDNPREGHYEVDFGVGYSRHSGLMPATSALSIDIHDALSKEEVIAALEGVIGVLRSQWDALRESAEKTDAES